MVYRIEREEERIRNSAPSLVAALEKIATSIHVVNTWTAEHNESLCPKCIATKALGDIKT